MPRRNSTVSRRPKPSAGGRRAPLRRDGPALPQKPRKSLGQNFLHDQDVLARIVAEGGFHAGEQVLEVGGGTGELTVRLAATVGHLVSVEIDETLVRHLRARLAPFLNAAVVNSDILDHAPEALLEEGGGHPPYVVAGNVPYAITAPILRTFLSARVRPERMVLMVQREVAETLAAGPGKLSLLAVSVQFYGTVRVLFNVPRTAFTPVPRVDSAVVRIDVHSVPVVDVQDEDRFFAVVRAGFRNPRKQIHNAIASGLWLPPDSAPALLRTADIDPMRRAQSLSLDEWERLSRAYGALKAEMDAARGRA